MAMGKPGGLLAILGGGKDESGDDALDAKTSAMRDLKEALDSGDFKAAGMAFKDAYDACAMAHGSETDEPEDAEYEE